MSGACNSVSGTDGESQFTRKGEAGEPDSAIHLVSEHGLLSLESRGRRAAESRSPHARMGFPGTRCESAPPRGTREQPDLCFCGVVLAIAETFHARIGEKSGVLRWHRVRPEIYRRSDRSRRAAALPARVAGSVLHAEFHEFSGLRRHSSRGRRQDRGKLPVDARALRGGVGGLADAARQGRRPSGGSRGAARSCLGSGVVALLSIEHGTNLRKGCMGGSFPGGDHFVRLREIIPDK